MDKVVVDGRTLVGEGAGSGVGEEMRQREGSVSPPRLVKQTVLGVATTGARPLVPPLNFSPVETNIYRSGVPLPTNHAFLRTLGLRTIVWLALEDPPDSLVRFCDEEAVALKGFPPSTEEMVPLTTIVEGIQLLLDASTHPLLVCCAMGGHRTGALVGCFRKMQGWNLASVSEEYRRFTNNRGASRLLVELMVEQFDVSCVEFVQD